MRLVYVSCFAAFYFLLGNGAYAQPIYEAADYANAGDTFRISEAPPQILFNNYNQTGASFSWDYSGLSANNQELVELQNPRSAGYYISWLGLCALSGGNPFNCPQEFDQLTNQAFSSPDTLDLGGLQLFNETDHLFKSPASLTRTISGFRVGSAGGSLPIVGTFQQPDTVFHFPLQYQARDSGDYYQRLEFTAQGSTNAWILSGTRITEVDGYGDIKTPFKTYSNVLRVKTLLTQRDTLITAGETLTFPNTQIIYQWFSPNEAWPVFEASGSVIFGQNLITNVSYLDTFQCLPPDAAFIYQPFVPQLDSATNSVEVSFTNFTQNGTQYFWSFGDGTDTASFSPSHTYTMSGTYQVQLVACNTACSPNQCDTTVLPIFVQAAPVSRDVAVGWQPSIQIAPHPVGDWLHISRADAATVQVQVMDLQGRMVHTTNWQQQQLDIDLQAYPTGMYVLRLRREDGAVYSQVFMKR